MKNNRIVGAARIALLATVQACVWLFNEGRSKAEQAVIGMEHALVRPFWLNRGTRQFANVNVPGAGTRQSGARTYLCGLVTDWTTFAAAFPVWSNDRATTSPAGRFALVIMGADENHIRISSAATDIPIGVCTDVPDATEDPLNVLLFGATTGTIPVIATGSISVNALVQSNGDGTVKTAVTTGYAIGRAVIASSATGDLIEIRPLGDSGRALVS